jgi:hypothetical protein
MSTRFSRFALPIGFFGLAVLAWAALGKVAVFQTLDRTSPTIGGGFSLSLRFRRIQFWDGRCSLLQSRVLFVDYFSLGGYSSDGDMKDAPNKKRNIDNPE